MEGKGCWRDNVFVEAPLALGETRGLPPYLHRGAGGRAGIGRCFAFYNGVRRHSSLACRMPDQLYFNQPLPAAA